MDEKTAKKVEGTWKTLTVIGAIAAAGFAAASHLAGYQKADEATTQHEAILESTETTSSEIRAEVKDAEMERQNIRFVNVRIEFSQQQINERLELIAEQTREARTHAEREVQDERIQELESRIEARDRVLRQSYMDRPIVNEDDPMAGLDL